MGLVHTTLLEREALRPKDRACWRIHFYYSEFSFEDRSSWHWGPWRKPHLSHLPLFGKSYMLAAQSHQCPGLLAVSLDRCWVATHPPLALVAPGIPWHRPPFRSVLEPAHTTSQSQVEFPELCKLVDIVSVAWNQTSWEDFTAWKWTDATNQGSPPLPACC